VRLRHKLLKRSKAEEERERERESIESIEREGRGKKCGLCTDSRVAKSRASCLLLGSELPLCSLLCCTGQMVGCQQVIDRVECAGGHLPLHGNEHVVHAGWAAGSVQFVPSQLKAI